MHSRTRSSVVRLSGGGDGGDRVEPRLFGGERSFRQTLAVSISGLRRGYLGAGSSISVPGGGGGSCRGRRGDACWVMPASRRSRRPFC